MTTHTPGPWHRGPRFLTSNGDTIVVRLEQVREPDARLIAAAPTLLDALQQIAWAADGGRQFSNLAASPALFESIRDMARAAIAKTEGTSESQLMQKKKTKRRTKK